MPFKRLRRHANFQSSQYPRADKKFKFLSGVSTLALWGILLFLVVVIGSVVFFFTQVPSPDTLTSRNVAQSTKIYDRNGELLYDIFQNQNRTPVKLADIPDNVKKATISIEDKDFYRHQGFDVMGIARSFFNLIIHRRVEGGGSTLTQQLVKNALLTSDINIVRKMKELILAIQVERTYSKDQILEMYLNEIPYGGTAYGIESAANLYFGKHAKDLDLAEASLLAGLPQRPSVYSPYGTHPELAKVRQAEVLRRMVEDHYISQQQADAAKAEPLTYRTSQNELGFKAPHFVLYVKQKLIEQFGDKMVEQGGLKVTTTLDNKLQEDSQKIVYDEVSKLKSNKIGNGAAVVLNPQNGQILAMIGSKDYFGKSEPEGCIEGKNCVFEPNVNVAINPRQPGSATKPITYAAAMQKGYTAATVLEDVPTDFPGGANLPVYRPVNYDGQFRGPVQVRYALGNSFNIPAVKMLALVGVEPDMELGYSMGLSTWEPTKENVNSVGLSLTLGGRETKLVDLTTAFGVLANGGKREDPISILKVTDSKGKTLYEYRDSEGVKVLDEGISFIISNILSDNGARTAAFGSNSFLVVPGKTVSVKTGTTDEKRDNWAVGYTPSMVVGVWVGNNDNTPLDPKIASGVTGASPIWQKIMIRALKDKPDEKPKQPDNISYIDIDGLMGGKTKDGSPTRKEYFIKGTEPNAVSPAYQRLKVCKNNGHQLSGDGEDGEDKDIIQLKEDDPTGANKWQDGINKWVLTAANALFVGTAKGCNGIPGFSGGSQGGVISIANVPNGANVPRVFDVLANVNSPAGVKKVTWQIDGQQKNVQTGGQFAQHVEFPAGDKGSHTISVILEDNNGQTYTASIGVTVAL
jgi:1A family penicillin-binding protein